MARLVLAAPCVLSGLAAAAHGQECRRTRDQWPPARPASLCALGAGYSLYAGDSLVFTGVLQDSASGWSFRALTDSSGGRVTQVFKWTRRWGGPLALDVVVPTSIEGFAAEAELAEDALVLVRHADGPATNLRNRAVYDRRADWVVSVDQPARVTVVSAADAPHGRQFRLRITGNEIVIRYRPRFYQRHRGLHAYEPWRRAPWGRSVAGWTSWYAFRDTVTERQIRETADVLAETLLPFGYEYLQIDDGFQQTPIGVVDHWLTANAKFASGLGALRRYIRDRGLTPGIWTNTTFHQEEWAKANPGYFVPSPDGGPAYGNWVGYVMDGSNPATLRTLVRPVYDSLARDGWQYFKVDALRHLLYEGYNSHAEYFATRKVDREVVYRGFVQAIRDAIGPERFMLGSWGPRPELIGILDACRLGDDGFGYGGFAQFNSFNNVVWRNDPDHIEISQADAYRATTLTALTGSLLMLTDPPSVYKSERVEAARRAAPVPVTMPGQLYDVDPSRTRLLGETMQTVSGAGPRPFEADQRLTMPLYQLDVARAFGQWSVLARTEGAPARIDLSQLGLWSDRDYHVFDFWAKRWLGSFRGVLDAGAIDARYAVQVLCIRERAAHPQLLATNRHVTCGGPDLASLAWSDRVLKGESLVVGGDGYELFVAEPEGFRFARLEVEGAEVVANRVAGGMRTVRLLAPRSGRVAWRIHYE